MTIERTETTINVRIVYEEQPAIKVTVQDIKEQPGKGSVSGDVPSRI